MSEKPILFSGEMVRAILEGRKTQARRALTKQPLDIIPMVSPNRWVTLETRNPNHGRHIRCRYGVPGDMLWVRESFALYKGEYIYRADYNSKNPFGDANPIKWKPSVHMPREACRLVLKIEKIRVERVQKITLLDAIAEGCSADRHAVIEFINLWNSINAKRGFNWNMNPWVWVIEFKMVGAGGEPVQSSLPTLDKAEQTC